MISNFRPILFSCFIVAFLMVTAISACAGDQKDLQRQTPIGASGDDVILQTFDQTHAAIIAQVRQGALPENVEAKANELKVELTKYLIKANADLQILEVDVLYASAEKRKTALKKLMDLSARREHVKVQYLQRLQALLQKNAGSEATTPPPAVPQSVESKPKDAEEKTSGTKWQTKDIDIEITIAPEDISTGEHD